MFLQKAVRIMNQATAASDKSSRDMDTRSQLPILSTCQMWPFDIDSVFLVADGEGDANPDHKGMKMRVLCCVLVGALCDQRIRGLSRRRLAKRGLIGMTVLHIW